MGAIKLDSGGNKMIICHSRKFIFVKTKKTAGTTVEIALSRACVEGDIVTDLAERREERFKDEPANALARKRHIFSIDKGAKRQQFTFSEHSNISHPFMMFGQAVRDYKIITVERNPWEKVISQFFYLKKSRLDDAAEFSRFVENGEFVTDFVLYGVRGVPLYDYCIRQEHLQDDLEIVRNALSLPECVSVGGISTKTTERPKEQTRRKDMYNETSRNLVAAAFLPEIVSTGYSFETSDCPPIRPSFLLETAKRAFIEHTARRISKWRIAPLTP